jgi:putative oxidoreductase
MINTLTKQFPFVTLPQALIILRVAVAIFFMAHAVVRVANGSIPRFADFLALKGFPLSLAIVWVITAYEIIGGALMALGVWVRGLALGLMCIAAGGIVIIHAKLGWFVGEHGVGGVEYSLCLLVALLTLAAADRSDKQTADKIK